MCVLCCLARETEPKFPRRSWRQASRAAAALLSPFCLSPVPSLPEQHRSPLICTPNEMAATKNSGNMASSIKLRAVGFCGVDSSVDPELLVLISRKFPFAEWGVLL